MLAHVSTLRVLRSDHPSFHECCVVLKLCSRGRGDAALNAICQPDLG
jgi:hypothetical protein